MKKSVSVSSLQEAKRLVQAAALHLPDKDPTEAGNNESLRKATEMYIDIAIQTPNSYTEVGRAIQNMVAFAQNASVKSIQGTVRATPSEGNAPLNVSFDAINVIDPSGTTPPAQNYIWWIRGNNGSRQELGRGPSINQTFTNEGTYSVNLDVISASRNKKGKIDVLPFTTTTIINVKPKLGEIVLLVNGINVTNLDSLKVSPTVANNGLFFDASASRAIGN